MTEERAKSDQSAPEGRPAQRKKYEKPSFRFERVFETMALSCGKVSTFEFQCHSRPKSS